MAFGSSADIGNRALQHCGVPRMNAALGFSENSQRASETSFAYGKVKRAELGRNIWTFATRRSGPSMSIRCCSRRRCGRAYGPDTTSFTCNFKPSALQSNISFISSSESAEIEMVENESPTERKMPHYGKALMLQLYRCNLRNSAHT
jgi:hypothetical protein